MLEQISVCLVIESSEFVSSASSWAGTRMPRILSFRSWFAQIIRPSAVASDGLSISHW